ncbi:DUF4913 domain-containing protein [Nonomuraea sp. NPDC049400]|uniref:DUF4913 domain-containing protein n=1 Tax=Nonomuraea sp. NPDC049400 TaxID=3364352 RepID=UPI0037998F9F
MTDTPEEMPGTPAFSGPVQEPLDFFELPANVDPGEQQDETLAGPRFIFLLDGTEYAVELPLLKQWVNDLLIPEYLADRIPSSTALWCPVWWEHPEAVGRLHGLWLAWQYWIDPEAGGFTGPDTWHNTCLDPAMRELRAPNGPFSRCMSAPDKPAHRPAKHVSWSIPVTAEPSPLTAGGVSVP